MRPGMAAPWRFHFLHFAAVLDSREGEVDQIDCVARFSPDRDAAGVDVSQPVARGVNLVLHAMLFGIARRLQFTSPVLTCAGIIRGESASCIAPSQGAIHLSHSGSCRTAKFCLVNASRLRSVGKWSAADCVRLLA
jgi:hypothetical protein